jgi:hypothetical protein
MDEVFSGQPDLTDQPISSPDAEYFTDSISFVCDGTHFAAYALATLDCCISFLIIHLFTCAYIVWVISLPGPLP